MKLKAGVTSDYSSTRTGAVSSTWSMKTANRVRHSIILLPPEGRSVIMTEAVATGNHSNHDSNETKNHVVSYHQNNHDHNGNIMRVVDQKHIPNATTMFRVWRNHVNMTIELVVILRTRTTFITTLQTCAMMKIVMNRSLQRLSEQRRPSCEQLQLDQVTFNMNAQGH